MLAGEYEGKEVLPCDVAPLTIVRMTKAGWSGILKILPVCVRVHVQYGNCQQHADHDGGSGIDAAAYGNDTAFMPISSEPAEWPASALSRWYGKA